MNLNELNLDNYKKIKKDDWYVPGNLIQWLRTHEFKQLGQGYYSSVWSSEKEDFVVKINNGNNIDKNYIKFINFCHKNRGNPHLPKIGKIKTYETWYIVFIEKLYKLPNPEIFGFPLLSGAKMGEVIRNIVISRPSNETEIEEMLPEEVRKNKNIQQLISIIKLLIDFIIEENVDARNVDLHAGNIMVRDDNTFVMTDPVSDIFDNRVEKTNKEEDKLPELIDDWLKKHEYVKRKPNIWFSQKEKSIAVIQEGEANQYLKNFVDYCNTNNNNQLLSTSKILDVDNFNIFYYKEYKDYLYPQALGMNAQEITTIYKNIAKFKLVKYIDILNVINEALDLDYEDEENEDFYTLENITSDKRMNQFFNICKILSNFIISYNIPESVLEFKEGNLLLDSRDNIILGPPFNISIS